MGVRIENLMNSINRMARGPPSSSFLLSEDLIDDTIDEGSEEVPKKDDEVPEANISSQNQMDVINTVAKEPSSSSFSQSEDLILFPINEGTYNCTVRTPLKQ